MIFNLLINDNSFENVEDSFYEKKANWNYKFIKQFFGAIEMFGDL